MEKKLLQQWNISSKFMVSMEKPWFYKRLFFKVLIVKVIVTMILNW